jgi:membrane protein DedA with SNARE-associated domain
MQTVFAWITQYGYPALFSLLVLGLVGLPVPDETLLTFCGYLIYTHRLHFGFTYLAGVTGSLCGITISYWLGLRFGRLVLMRFGKYIHLTPERVTKVEQQFERFGPGLLTIGYFIPGVRHFTAVVAGMSGLRWRRFALFAYPGAALWIGTFLTLGYVVGERWEHTTAVVHRYLLMATGVAAVILLVVWLLRYNRKVSPTRE